MKKITYFVMLSVICLMITSCNSFESDAKAQMEKTMLSLAKDPDSYKIKDIKTLYSTDSVVVLQFTSSGKNGYGATITKENEYIYLKSSKDGRIHEALRNLEKESSIMEEARSEYDENKDNLKEGVSKEDYKQSVIYVKCLGEVLFGGREVKSDEERAKENDVENW